jgi:hypothetical protein
MTKLKIEQFLSVIDPTTCGYGQFLNDEGTAPFCPLSTAYVKYTNRSVEDLNITEEVTAISEAIGISEKVLTVFYEKWDNEWSRIIEELQDNLDDDRWEYIEDLPADTKLQVFQTALKAAQAEEALESLSGL